MSRNRRILILAFAVLVLLANVANGLSTGSAGTVLAAVAGGLILGAIIVVAVVLWARKREERQSESN